MLQLELLLSLALTTVAVSLPDQEDLANIFCLVGHKPSLLMISFARSVVSHFDSRLDSLYISRAAPLEENLLLLPVRLTNLSLQLSAHVAQSLSRAVVAWVTICASAMVLLQSALLTIIYAQPAISPVAQKAVSLIICDHSTRTLNLPTAKTS